MTLTAMRPVLGLSKGREVSLWSVDQASRSISAKMTKRLLLQTNLLSLLHFEALFEIRPQKAPTASPSRVLANSRLSAMPIEI